MSEPNRENIRKWVDALRSGEYVQTTGALGRVDNDRSLSYCCLGVACVAAGVEGKRADTGDLHFAEGQGTLPQTVMDWLGVDHRNPTLNGEDGLRTAAAILNDGYGYTFDMLADAIERTYLAEVSSS